MNNNISEKLNTTDNTWKPISTVPKNNNQFIDLMSNNDLYINCIYEEKNNEWWSHECLDEEMNNEPKLSKEELSKKIVKSLITISELSNITHWRYNSKLSIFKYNISFLKGDFFNLPFNIQLKIIINLNIITYQDRHLTIEQLISNKLNYAMTINTLFDKLHYDIKRYTNYFTTK